MAKGSAPPPRPISEAEVVAFMSQRSDFAFEMKVLRKLTGLQFVCEHGGCYTDPVTGTVVRQFDIRAFRDGAFGAVALAVECKHYSDSHLVVSTAPRTAAESYVSMAVPIH